MQRRLNNIKQFCILLLFACILRWNVINRKLFLRKLFAVCLGLVLLLSTKRVFPLTENYPFFYTAHMLEISFLYFVIPPLLLTGLALKNPSIFGNLLSRSPFYSMLTFALLLTMEHIPIGIEMFERLGARSSTLIWVQFLLALDMWRPMLLSSWSHKQVKTYMTWNTYILLPACTFLLLDAVVTPIDKLVSTYSLVFCVSEGITLNDIPTWILPPRVDQGIAAIIMITIHKGSMFIAKKLHPSS